MRKTLALYSGDKHFAENGEAVFWIKDINI